MAVKLGLDPIRAIKMATINTAKCYGLKHLGAISPGFQADFVVLDNLTDLNVTDVFYKGKRLNEDDTDSCASLQPRVKAYRSSG